MPPNCYPFDLNPAVCDDENDLYEIFPDNLWEGDISNGFLGAGLFV